MPAARGKRWCGAVDRNAFAVGVRNRILFRKSRCDAAFGQTLEQCHTMVFFGNAGTDSSCLENLKIEHAADGKHSHSAGLSPLHHGDWKTAFRKRPNLAKKVDQTWVHLDPGTSGQFCYGP